MVARIAFAAAFLAVAPAGAGLIDVRVEKLPQEKPVLKAYADVATIEVLVRKWHDKWTYDVPKADAVATAKASLAELQKALGSSPDNEELLLLTGLVAHYAYNLDIQEAYDVAASSLEKAAKLAPADPRPGWFLGIHQCQADQPNDGMQKLLATEQLLPWEQLPPSFWDDYVYCASIANMPAHTLRAGDRLTRLRAAPSQERDFLMETARKRLKIPDLTATYSGRGQVWGAEKHDSQVAFTSSMCGISVTVPGAWRVGMSDAVKGACRLLFDTGPLPGKAGDVFPNILVIVRQPKPNETLADFLKSFLYGATAERISAICPSDGCLALETVKLGAYGPEGDGHLMLAAFKRDAPEFPGLLFEKPAGPPAIKGNGPMQYFLPEERLRRLDGPLYYLVTLDTAESVRTKAVIDYTTFLAGMRVE